MARIVSGGFSDSFRRVSRTVSKFKPEGSEGFSSFSRDARAHRRTYAHAHCVKVSRTLRTVRFESVNPPANPPDFGGLR